MFFALSDDRSIEKACNAMVPNPIYEGPLYETIDPEFKSLTSLPPAPVVMEPPRYLPIRQALPSEVARALHKTKNHTVENWAGPGYEAR